MVVLLTILHVLFCLFLILVILLQTGKGGGMGAAFGGGGSSTVFGPRGAGSFIGKLTGIVAFLFMVSSLSLAYLSSSHGTGIAERVSLAEVAAATEGVGLDEARRLAGSPTGDDEETASPEPAEVAGSSPDAGVAYDAGVDAAGDGEYDGGEDPVDEVD